MRKTSLREMRRFCFSLAELTKAKDNYRSQHKAAKRRGIAWCFTFESWCGWWDAQLGAGWLHKRGKFKNDYVMARNKDKGPYSSQNVQAILATENASSRKINGTSASGAWMGQAGSKNTKAKLTENDVSVIRKRLATGEKIKMIAADYKIHVSSIYRIRKNGWRHVK